MPSNNRGNRKRKNGIWFAQHGKASVVPCHWCKKIITFNESTLDHEPALAEGGNLKQGVISCWNCNHERAKITHRKVQAKRAETVITLIVLLAQYRSDLRLRLGHWV